MSVGFEIHTKKPIENGKVVVIVPAGFGNRFIPAFPIIDAAAYAATYKAQTPVFQQIEAVHADEAAAKTIAAFEQAGYKVIKSDTPLPERMGEDLNPGALEASLDSNDWSTYRSFVRDLAAKSNADYVVIEGWRAVVQNVGLFGLNGGYFVSGAVAVFTPDCKLVALGSFHSGNLDGSPAETHAYDVNLSKTEGAKELLLKALTVAAK
jgi:hypothetical protein